MGGIRPAGRTRAGQDSHVSYTQISPMARQWNPSLFPCRMSGFPFRGKRPLRKRDLCDAGRAKISFSQRPFCPEGKSQISTPENTWNPFARLGRIPRNPGNLDCSTTGTWHWYKYEWEYVLYVYKSLPPQNRFVVEFNGKMRRSGAKRKCKRLLRGAGSGREAATQRTTANHCELVPLQIAPWPKVMVKRGRMG